MRDRAVALTWLIQIDAAYKSLVAVHCVPKLSLNLLLYPIDACLIPWRDIDIEIVCILGELDLFAW